MRGEEGGDLDVGNKKTLEFNGNEMKSKSSGNNRRCFQLHSIDHMYRMSIMALVVGNNNGQVDGIRCMKMALVHDLAEGIDWIINDTFIFMF